MIDCCFVCHDKVVFGIFGVLVNVLCDAVELNVDDYLSFSSFLLFLNS